MDGRLPPEPIFRHLDDPEVPWQEVKRQRNADGSTSSVWEQWFAFRADPPYLSLLGRYDPGMIVRRHGHRSPHVVYVVEGSIWCGDRRCDAGTHIELPDGAAFGPFRAGPEGVTMFEVMPSALRWRFTSCHGTSGSSSCRKIGSSGVGPSIRAR